MVAPLALEELFVFVASLKAGLGVPVRAWPPSSLRHKTRRRLRNFTANVSLGRSFTPRLGGSVNGAGVFIETVGPAVGLPRRRAEDRERTRHALERHFALEINVEDVGN